jgi:hypothetical protein
VLYYTLDTKESDMAKVDGQVVKVGDWVSFKCDIEQSGRITRIEGDRLFLEAGPNGFDGDYIGGQETTVQSARDCWIEG